MRAVRQGQFCAAGGRATGGIHLLATDTAIWHTKLPGQEAKPRQSFCELKAFTAIMMHSSSLHVFSCEVLTASCQQEAELFAGRS